MKRGARQIPAEPRIVLREVLYDFESTAAELWARIEEHDRDIDAFVLGPKVVAFSEIYISEQFLGYATERKTGWTLALGCLNLSRTPPPGRSWPGGPKVLADVQALLRDPQLHPARLSGPWYHQQYRGSDFYVDEILERRFKAAIAMRRMRTLIVYSQPVWIRSSHLGGRSVRELQSLATRGPQRVTIRSPLYSADQIQYRSWRDAVQLVFEPLANELSADA